MRDDEFTFRVLFYDLQSVMFNQTPYEGKSRTSSLAKSQKKKK